MSAAGIAWLPWGAHAFARARAEDRPVLLALTASWCRFSAEMDRTSYADERVVDLVHSRFVPIRVDADRRPDVSLRYGLGGWPTTALLTPAGDVLCAGTSVAADRLARVLREVHDAYRAGDHARAAAPHASTAPAAAPLTPARLADQVLGSFDPQHGGFGVAPKFPHAAPLRLALDLCRAGDSGPWREVAITSLDAMGWGPLYDEEHGGFFRCSRDRDWSGPSTEKLLEVNASLLSLYVDAFDALQLARYAERAEDVLRYVQTWLADPVDGGWGGSQRADPERGPDAPAGGPYRAPPVDRTMFADWNAAMVSAALHAGRVMQDTSLAEFAIRSLERVVLLCYRPGAGVAHYIDAALENGHTPAHGEVRGLLGDQVAMAAAHLDAFEATGNVVYQMMAEELALYALRTMWDDDGGGFFDRAPDQAADVGLLRGRLKPFAANCAAARMLRRLAAVSGTGAFAEHADRILGAVAGGAAAEGPQAADYLLSLGEAGGR